MRELRRSLRLDPTSPSALVNCDSGDNRISAGFCFLHSSENIYFSKHTMEYSRFHFSFTNSFDSSSPDWPTFLRHHGVKGQVQILNALESNIEKVKIVLRGIFIFFLS